MFKTRSVENGCPLLNMKPCVETQCSWWTVVKGKDPQSNKDIDKGGCAIAWLPILQIENSQETRQAGAAVESLRNNVVSRIEQNKKLSHPL